MTDVDTRPSTVVPARVGVAVCDQGGAVVTADEQATELLGLPEEWRAEEPAGVPAPPLAVLVRQALHAGTPATWPVLITRRALLVVITPNPDGAVVEVRAVQSDLRASAGLLDPATGLPGAVLLADRLNQAVTRTRTLGGLVTVVLAEARDDESAALGTRLRAGLRADHTVARYGASTFAVVAEHTRGPGAATAERVRAAGGDLAVRVGWATSDGSVPGHELLANAQHALHH